MHASFDADDFLKRGILGSIIGFRKRSSSKTEQKPSEASSHQSGSAVQVPKVAVSTAPVEESSGAYRSEYEIYREIVSEAEIFERSATTTPASEFSQSGANTPQLFYNHTNQHLLPPTPTPMMSHQIPYQMAMTTIAPHPIPVDQNGIPIGTQCPMAPPPYSTFPPTTMCNINPAGGFPNIITNNVPLNVKQEIQDQLICHNGKPAVSIEEIVKLVVSALKDSQLEENRDENPEDILRRKRVQNNLAAARYRKRQREAREMADYELGELTRRNEELKRIVEKMEHEIEHLKRSVLNYQ